MNNQLSYQSFFWSIGTTSFRMKQFNRMIEEQLRLLNEFWQINGNENLEWDTKTQEEYYEFIKKKSFITGNEKNKAKNAREKTSGLVDIGLIYNNRRLTQVGERLLQISLEGNFVSDNELLIEKDSFIYMKQLLKTSYKLNHGYVRPFIVLLYILTKKNELLYDEFKYLLPLCIDKNSTEIMIKNIEDVRNNKKNIDTIIIEKFMSMNNYKQAYNELINKNTITENIITKIGMNRKSKTYDKEYYNIYTLLREIYIDKNYSNINLFYSNLKSLKLSRYWVKYFFINGAKKKIIIDDLQNTKFDTIRNEKDLRKIFFEFMHLNKIKATLDDYFDLNKRYIGLSDIVTFQDNKVMLSIIPKIYFTPIIDTLYN